MIRTQILLDNQLKKELLSYSQVCNKSISQITRESLRNFLNSPKKKKQVGLAGLIKISKMNFVGPKNLSKQVDQILYK